MYYLYLDWCAKGDDKVEKGGQFVTSDLTKYSVLVLPYISLVSALPAYTSRYNTYLVSTKRLVPN